MTPEAGHTPRHVVVIGAGIVGACVARELVQAGTRVTMIEAGEPGGTQATSFGNGAFISPASIIPMSVPGLWRKVPGYLLDRSGPLTIRWRSLPRLAPWLLRFLAAGRTEDRLRRTVAHLHSLLHDAPERHLALAAGVGAGALIRQDGLLYAFPDRAAFRAEARSWSLRRASGLTWCELEGPALHAFEPALSDRYQFAVLLQRGAHCFDPGAYVRAILNAAGADMVRARVTGLCADAQGVTVLTDAGPVTADAAVIAAGMGSAQLARLAGDRIPLEAERGYHIEIPDPQITLRVPIMPSDGKMANTMTSGGLRAAGQVELSHTDVPPDWTRAGVLMDHLERTYPALAPIDRDSVRMWHGNRPSTPDGLPVIGPASGMAGVWYAFGHGHVGLNAAPRTADLLARMIAGRPLDIDAAPFSASRFS